jgi:hypothetical protein
MNTPSDNNETDANTTGSSFGAWMLRIFGAIFWCFIYIGFVWYLDHRSGFEKLIGFATLFIGAAAILLPRSAFRAQYWYRVIYIFFGLGIFLLILMN